MKTITHFEIDARQKKAIKAKLLAKKVEVSTEALLALAISSKDVKEKTSLDELITFIKYLEERLVEKYLEEKS